MIQGQHKMGKIEGLIMYINKIKILTKGELIETIIGKKKITKKSFNKRNSLEVERRIALSWKKF